MRLVAVQLSVLGAYLPPVFRGLSPPSIPAHTIISVPLQTAVWYSRATGAPAVLVAVQLSVLGLYLPPVVKRTGKSIPPQTIISLPVHTAVCPSRASGALVTLVGVHVSSVHPPAASVGNL